MTNNKMENLALKTVLQYQREVKAAEQVVAVLLTTIDEKNQEIASLESFTTTLPDLIKQREDMLADISLGVDKQAELASLKEAIFDEEKKQREHDELMKTVNTTVKPALPGLLRKLATAKSELARLQEMKAEIIKEFLKSEAEQIAINYMESILNLTNNLQRLRSIGNMIRIYGGNIFNNYSGGALAVPIFNLNACMNEIHASNPGQLKAIVAVGPYSDLSPVMQTESERFKAQGVIL